jgi:hypothetical protein
MRARLSSVDLGIHVLAWVLVIPLALFDAGATFAWLAELGYLALGIGMTVRTGRMLAPHWQVLLLRLSNGRAELAAAAANSTYLLFVLVGAGLTALLTPNLGGGDFGPGPDFTIELAAGSLGKVFIVLGVITTLLTTKLVRRTTRQLPFPLLCLVIAGAVAVILYDATPDFAQNSGGVSARITRFISRFPNVEHYPSATHKGMTMTVLSTSGPAGMVQVGTDHLSNVYSGDTPADVSLPILCLNVTNAPVPVGLTTDFYHGWARGHVALSPPSAGSQLSSRKAADNLCATAFGPQWRMAEFHDGGGGWHFWAVGAIPAGVRFWTAIEDQPANPWD